MPNLTPPAPLVKRFVAQFIVGQMGEFGEQLPITHGTPVYLAEDIARMFREPLELIADRTDNDEIRRLAQRLLAQLGEHP